MKRGVDWLGSLAPAMAERLHIGVGASSVVDPLSRAVDSDMGVPLPKSVVNVENEYVQIAMYSNLANR